MIKNKFSLIYLVVFAFVALFFSGCTSISAIKGLSSQNLRNAHAMSENIGTLLTISDVSLKYSVNSLLVDANKKIVLNTTKTRRDYLTPSGDADLVKIRQAAKNLSDLANAKPKETKELFIRKSRNNNPLIAAVSFDDGVTVNVAGAIVKEIDQIYRHAGLSNEDMFWRAISTISQFGAIRDNNTAANDVLEAYQLLRSTILKQTAIYVEAAEQLDSAAAVGASAPAILKGITENQNVIETVATVVLNRTNDENRANAAKELLSKMAKE